MMFTPNFKKNTISTIICLALSGTLFTSQAYAAEPTLAELQKTIQDLKSQVDTLKETVAKINSTKGQGLSLGTNANATKPLDIAIGNGAVGNGAVVGASNNGGGIAIGNGANVSYSNGPSDADGDIAIGKGASVNNYASQGGSIAIGKNARIDNMAGGQEKTVGMGQTEYKGSNCGFFGCSAQIPQEPEKAIGSVALGNNTFARSGSVMIGSHNYKGQLGDEEIDTSNTRDLALNVYATSIGANSFSDGMFATTTGAYSIMTNDYNGGRMADMFGGAKNFGAVINGSFNSIESKTAGQNAGVANAIVGVANKTANSNGTLVFGAGNTVTNSIGNINTSKLKSEVSSANELSDILRETIEASDGGGSVLVMGGGNAIDSTTKSQVTGVGNSVSGTNNDLLMVNGYKNTLENTNSNVVFGSNNILKGTADNKAEDNIIFSFNENQNEARLRQSLKHTVAIGSGISAQTDNSVYLGTGSANAYIKDKTTRDVTDVDGSASIGNGEYTQNMAGYNQAFAGLTANGIVSIGSQGNERRLQNVAAGLISNYSTDAINGSQLKSVIDTIQTVQNAQNNPVHFFNGGKVVNNQFEHGDTTFDIALSGLNFDFGDGINVEKQTKDGKDYAFITLDRDSIVIPPAGVDKDYVDDTHTIVTTGNNLSVSDSKNDKGATTYNVTLNKKIDLGEEGSVSAGGVTIDKEGIDVNNKKVKNVANGEVSEKSKEAVNGSQLYQLQQQVNNIDLSDVHIDTSRLDKLIQNNTNSINKLDNKIDKVDKRLKRGIASVAAIAGLTQPTKAGETMFSAGLGGYDNQQALAIGYSRISDNDHHIIKFGLATSVNSTKQMTWSASYGWKF